MKRVLSVSLGSSSRDKRVQVDFKGIPMIIERIGTDGDIEKARRLYLELDDKVDNCRLIKFVTPNKACTGDAYTEGALRNLESIALTAMTTGLPVYFYVTERAGELCIAKTMVIYRP